MYAQDIAEVLDVNVRSVVDLSGQNASVTLEPKGLDGVETKISAFTVVPEGSSANALAKQLYSSRFRSQILGSTIQVLAQHSSQDIVTGPLNIPVVAIKPERFTPLPRTTATPARTDIVTSTATSTVASTVATTASTETTTMLPEEPSSSPTTSMLHEDLRTTQSAFLATSGMEGSSKKPEKSEARGVRLLTWVQALAAIASFASA